MIADELGVSLTPVREALAMLEPSGLVVRVARKGYKVAAPLAGSELDLVLDARSVIETAAARRAADAMSPADLGQLRLLLSAQREHLAELGEPGADPDERRRAIREFAAADSEFHAVILRSCGNPFLQRLAEQLSGQWHRTRMSIEAGLTDGADAIREHAAVLDALDARDADGAEACMARHIDRIRRDAGARS